ncbi:MAG: ankyrin repeat domain-containing protein [Candidatus Babeliales bacterium]|nr:ankyrin repeat domain-containing protein [Candidatus Babeliales bacterium]
MPKLKLHCLIFSLLLGCNVLPMQKEEIQNSLIGAANSGNLEQAKKAIALGADPNIKNKKGKLPLGYAVEMGHESVVQFLLKHGANPSLKDDEGKTAINRAKGEMKSKLQSLIDRQRSKNQLKANPANASSSSSSSAPPKPQPSQNIQLAVHKIVKQKNALPIQPPINSNKILTPSSSSSSNSSSSPAQNISPKKVLVVNEAEIDALADKYKNPIPVKISDVRLTKKTLKHIFGMEIGDKKDPMGSFYLTGFHHDQQGQLRDQENIYYSSSKGHEGFREGFIAYTRQQFPVYKTFFSSMLSREKVISMMIEALQNVTKIEDQGSVWKIEGTTNNDMDIIVIIKKKDNTIVTFYPKSPRPAREVADETEELKTKFTKFFFNPSNKPLRQPLTDEELEQLLALYPDGIKFNMILAQVLSREGLFKSMYLSTLQKAYPGRVHIKKNLTNLYFTRESLKQIFSMPNDDSFPHYLSRTEILRKVKSALVNFGVHRISVGESFEVPFDREGNLIKIRAADTDKDNNFLFYIKINENTGVIEKFYPLFQ